MVFLLATVCFVRQSQAQGSLTPLYLSISGDGTVSPLQNGQLLAAGQNYEMEAIAAAGYAFSGWQQLDLFTLYEITVGPEGETNPPIISTVVSADPISSEQPVLDFTMQPVNVLYNVPGVEEITTGVGWQADFAPVPEPSSGALVTGGLIVILLLGKRRANHRRFNPHACVPQPPHCRPERISPGRTPSPDRRLLREPSSETVCSRWCV